MSEKCFSHAPLGPGYRSCDLWDGQLFVASAIADFPAQPPKDFESLYNTSIMY